MVCYHLDMREKDYVRLKAKIDADYRKNLEALERIWSMARGTPPAGHATPGSATYSDTTEKVPPPATMEPAALSENKAAQGLAKCVRDFVSTTSDSFTIVDVEKAVINHIPGVRRVSISTALKRFERRGGVVIVEKGSGRRPSRYRRADATTPKEVKEEPID